MINVSEIVKSWPVVDGWSIAPEGNDFRAGNGFRVGDDFWAGNDFWTGNGAIGLGILGFADGYWKSMSLVGNVAYIGAGFRWFTLAEATPHWENHDENRDETLLLMEDAKAIADLLGLDFS